MMHCDLEAWTSVLQKVIASDLTKKVLARGHFEFVVQLEKLPT